MLPRDTKKIVNSARSSFIVDTQGGDISALGAKLERMLRLETKRMFEVNVTRERYHRMHSGAATRFGCTIEQEMLPAPSCSCKRCSLFCLVPIHHFSRSRVGAVRSPKCRSFRQSLPECLEIGGEFLRERTFGGNVVTSPFVTNSLPLDDAQSAQYHILKICLQKPLTRQGILTSKFVKGFDV